MLKETLLLSGVWLQSRGSLVELEVEVEVDLNLSSNFKIDTFTANGITH